MREHGLAAALALAACGQVSLDGDSDAGPVDAPVVPDRCDGDIALEDAWECTTAAVCTVYSPCFGDALPVETCLQLDLELFDLSSRYGGILVESAVGAGNIAYDPQEMRRCLDAIGGLTCADIFGQDIDPFAACGAFIGQVPTQGSCTFDLECGNPGARCDRPGCPDEDVCCPGACVDPLALGDACINDQVCGPDAYCVDGICFDGAEGARCTDDYDCDDENYCEAGACTADRPSGSPCDSDAQCPSPESCVGRNMPNGGTCGRSLDTGDPCDNSCRSFASHYCDQPDPDVLGVCQPRVGAGTACEPSVMPCEIGLTCDDVTRSCTPAGQRGDSCDGATGCAFFQGLYCSTDIDPSAPGVCQGRQPDGAACTDGDHCESDLCVQGVCSAAAGCY